MSLPSIEKQILDLIDAGWKQIRRDQWESPDGGVWTGPHGAWLEYQASRNAGRIAELERKLSRLKSAVDTIPAALMLAGGPPYKLTFTEACLREIAESQK